MLEFVWESHNWCLPRSPLTAVITAKQMRWTTCVFLSSKQYICGKFKNAALQHRIVGPILVCPPTWKVPWTLERGVFMKLTSFSDWDAGNISHIIWQFITIVVCMQWNAYINIYRYSDDIVMQPSHCNLFFFSHLNDQVMTDFGSPFSHLKTSRFSLGRSSSDQKFSKMY